MRVVIEIPTGRLHHGKPLPNQSKAQVDDHLDLIADSLLEPDAVFKLEKDTGEVLIPVRTIIAYEIILELGDEGWEESR